jgi:hypothetical protein
MRTSPLPLRVTIHSAFAVLWLTGAVIFMLRHFFAVATDFGSAPHPWQPPLLLVHGVVAVAVTFLFGWIVAEHVSEAWRRGPERSSGLWLLVIIPLLIVTGFAAFFLVADRQRSINATIHEMLGLLLIVPAATHLVGARAQRLLKGRL